MGCTKPRRGALPDLKALGRPGQGPRSPGLPALSFTIQPPTSAACGLAAIPDVGDAKKQRTLPGRSEVGGNSGKDRQHDPEPDGRVQILSSSLLAFWASASFLTSLCLNSLTCEIKMTAPTYWFEYWTSPFMDLFMDTKKSVWDQASPFKCLLNNYDYYLNKSPARDPKRVAKA